MKPSDGLAPSQLDALPRLPRDETGPVFAEPWQAQAFALAVKLAEQGHFTWVEWAAALAAELKETAARGEPDDYFLCWVQALEKLATTKELASGDALLDLKDAWHHAYDTTPHGQPVVLKS